MTYHGRTALLLFCLAALPACASSRAPQELAEATAANVGVIGSHLKRVAAESRALGEQRAANVGALHAANARRRAAYNYDVALTKRSGGGENLKLIEQIDAWGKEVDGIFKAADGAERQRKETALASQVALDTKAEALSQIAEALATLAKDESAGDQARFLVGYAGQVRKEVDAQLKQSDASAAAANKLLKGVKANLTSEHD